MVNNNRRDVDDPVSLLTPRTLTLTPVSRRPSGAVGSTVTRATHNPCRVRSAGGLGGPGWLRACGATRPCTDARFAGLKRRLLNSSPVLLIGAATRWLARGGRLPALGGSGHRQRGASAVAGGVRGPPSQAAAATEGCHPEEAASRSNGGECPLLPSSLRLKVASVRSCRYPTCSLSKRGRSSGPARRRRFLEAVEKCCHSSGLDTRARSLSARSARLLMMAPAPAAVKCSRLPGSLA